MRMAIVAASGIHQITAESDQKPILPLQVQGYSLIRRNLIAAQNLIQLLGAHG
jgi:hypothetical protein